MLLDVIKINLIKIIIIFRTWFLSKILKIYWKFISKLSEIKISKV